MRRWIAAAAACAAVVSAAAEERWEFLLGGELAGSEVVEESAGGFSGRGSFSFQGARIETAYTLAFEPSGAPASYTLRLTAPGVQVGVLSSAASGAMTLTVSQNGTVAGSKAFPLSPALVILDNSVFGQYRQLARLLSPDGPSHADVQMLVPQALSLIRLDAVDLRREEGDILPRLEFVSFRLVKDEHQRAISDLAHLLESDRKYVCHTKKALLSHNHYIHMTPQCQNPYGFLLKQPPKQLFRPAQAAFLLSALRRALK